VVNITANGTTTLGDIHQCALQLTAYIRDPANWIHDSDIEYHFTRFLRNNHPTFTNLTGCAEQYINTFDHKLTLYGSGWVCPLTTGAVFGTASPRVMTASSWALMMIVVATSRLLIDKYTGQR